MDLHLTGDVAIVVGGARGLGLAIASAFVAEGAQVAILDRDPDGPAEARRLEEASRTRCAGLVVDATDFDAVRGAADDVRGRFGRCDHVVYAAGVGSGKFGFPFWELDPGDWDRVLRVNLIGAANVAHAFAPRMAEAKTGTLLFVASVAGQMGSQTDPPYSASKAGLINFAQCAAKDLAPFGVRVNSLCPGMIKTALNRSVYEAWAGRQVRGNTGAGGPIPSYEEWAGEKVKVLVPLGRWQTPEDVAAMAVFLASPAAGNVTGQTINVDGGYVMHW
ncbi:MAG: SDR family NAD(P)-dependent oxidoreductase [Paludisphaera borealis]|uniref:SDR family NAD(P)-dependent oxidoreductase n=1 Tax=Paludisphaera borealis TaxID=1387353 RepID=UPI00284DEBBC|nr:SDR family oxidoreductase [Paludisphaera borealis]MDR3622631.1 SDR family NAD(P)-dependent oxidoreductase [Paludisphaera borealis]